MDPWEAYKKEKEAKNGGKGSVNPWEQYQTEHGSGQITKTPTQPLFGGGYQTQLQREQKAQSLIPGAAKFTLQSQQTLQNSGKLPANALGRSYVDKSNEAQAKLMEVTARANQQAAAHNDSYGMAKSYADNQRAQQNIRWNNQQIRSQAQINRKDPVYAMAQDYDREQLKWYKQAAEQARQFAEAKVNSAMERIGQLDVNDERYEGARQELVQSQEALKAAEERAQRIRQASETRYQAEQYQMRTGMEEAARGDRLFDALQAEPEELRKEFEGTDNLLHYMTEQEKEVYRYYYNRDKSAARYSGKGSLKENQAQAYKKALWDELEYRKDTAKAQEQYLPKKGDGILLKGLKLLQYSVDSLLSGGERAVYGIDADLGGSPTAFETERDTRLGYAAALAGDSLGGNLYRQWGGAMQSTGQMLPAIFMGNIAAGALATMPASILGAAESATGGWATAQNIAKLAQDATFFASIKGNAYTEALQKGLKPEQAQAYSVLSALSEVGLERAIGGIAAFGGVSETALGAKVNQIDNILLRNAAHYGLNVAGEELEEGLQNFLDPLFVTILTGDKYQAPTGMEMLDTFVSTLMMVSVNNVGDTVDYGRQSKIRQNLQELAQQARSQGGDEYTRVAQNIEAWIQAVDADPENRAYTREDLLAATNMMQIAETMQTENGAQGTVSRPAAASVAEGRSEAQTAAPAETPDVRQNGQAQVDPQTAQILRQSAAQEAVSLSDSELQQEILDARREAGGTDQAAAIARIREQELTRSLEQRRAERGLGVNAPGLGRQSAQTATNEATENQMAAATAAAGTGGTYGTAGTAEGFNDGGQRNGSLGAGGEVGGLGGSPAGQVAGGQGQAAEAGAANQGQAVELEAVSARKLGVLGGTDNKTLRVIPPELESREMQQIRQEVEAKGQKVVFVRGQIERRSKGSGQIRHPNAIYQTNADGSATYYMRADLRSKSVQQLYAHESFHDVVKHNQALWRDMAEYLYAHYSQEEIDAMVDRYVEAYDGIYGTEEADMDRYLEEIFADAYAGIQRGRINTDAAGQTIQAYSRDIEDARRNSQTTQATQQTRGSPDQRFAFAGDTDELFSEDKEAEPKTKNNYQGVDLSKDSFVYDYDFLTAQPAMHEVILPEVPDIRDNRGKIDRTKVINKGLNNARKIGTVQDGKIAVTNRYSGRTLRVDTESIRHSLNGDLNRILTNGRLASVIGDVLYNAIPINALYDTAKGVNGTYAMAGYATDSLGREFVAIITVEQRSDNVIGIEAVDTVHAVSGRQKKGSQVSTKLQGVYPIKATDISIADFLEIVNRTHQSILSDDVLTRLHESRNPKGDYSGRVKFSAEEDTDAENDDSTKGSRDFDAMAVQKKRDLAEKATVQALRNRIARNEADLQGLEQLRQQGQWNAIMEERARNMRQSLEIDREALAKKQTASGGELRARIERQQTEIRALELARKSGAWNENAAKRLDELRTRNQADKDALREERKQSRQTREQPKVEKQEPRIARQELREGLLDLFHVPAGKDRAEIGKIINKFADNALESGTISTEERRDLVRRLYEAGVEFLPAEEYYKNIRDFVKKGRIYVSEEVRQDFGDDWAAFRARAWGNGIYLTNNQTDAGVDVWNQELAEAFPGSFDADATDMRQMLEAIVELAEEGKGEKVSLAEMMARNQRQTGESVDQQMDALERKVDQMIDTFAQKARLERTVREQGALRRIRERQDNREKMERSRQRKQENELRSQVMKDIQKLNRMRRKTAPEILAQIQEAIGNIDTVARSISEAGLEDLQSLARAYNEAKDDPNFLGNPYVEARLSRLQQTQLDDLDITQVTELGRTVCALVKSIQDNNKLLADQRHREISQAATAFSQEIQASRGSKSALANWTAVEHLSPTRFIQRLGGWLRGGEAERLSRTLEEGQTRKLEYQRQATRIFDKFLDDKKNRKWMQKAHGKQAEWIKVKVPVTDSQAKTTWREIEITPMMRVSLMMHAQNEDNLRHIETGGIRIPQKAAYLKGNVQEALARGERIKMRPETVRAIVKDATEQEKAFAGYLKQYFDVFSKEKINEVSMLLDGFERAGGNNYYHIKTDPDFLAKQPETVQQNLSLESIGSIVNERQHAGNPIVLEDATTALTEHIEQISKYYGFAVPIRDFNAVMNYTFHEEGNAFTGSVREGMQKKWGSGAQKYLDRLMADLQQRNSLQDTASGFLSKLRGNLAGASLMLNAAVAMSQAASLPGAAQSVGFDGVLAALGQFANPTRRISMDLIERYSPLLWYRNQGNSTQELGDYMKEQSLEAKLPLLFGMTQKVDSGTIKLLWYAAEHRVNRDTDLKPGTQAQIDAGTDPYYQEVARVFQRAVYDTQPNYTEMQRPHILRSPSDLTKALTMYKTVPLQYYNMMYEAAGRLMMDSERAKANASKENKAALKASRKFFADTFVGVLTANVVYVAMKALVKGVTFRDKKYRDEEGELTPEAAAKQLGLDLAETYAGSLIGGSELWWAAEKLMDALIHGKYSNTNSDGIEITALSAVEDTVDSVVKLGKALNKQDLHAGLGAIKDAAAQLAMNSGLPARNMETYLKAIVKWINPEWAQRYDNVFNETDKADLADERGRYLNAAIRVLMDNRAKNVEDRTVDELQRLWEAGQRGQIPTSVPTSFTRTVNGESETVELDAKQKAKYRETWNRTVSDALDRLTRDKAYLKANDKDKAAMIQKLYAFAGQAAKKAVLGDYEPDKWVQIGLDAIKMGVRADEYISFYVQLSGITSKDDDGETINGLKNSRGLELLGTMGWSDKQAEAVYLGAMASESLTEKEQIMVKAGMTWKQAAEVLGVVGNNWEHAEQIVRTKVSDKAKLKALSLYLGEPDYKAASAGVIFSVDLRLWAEAKKAADAAGNGNGSISQEEATNYLDGRKDLDLETKAYLWQMLCTGSKSKNNPYSTTMGESCWEYMQTVSKP